jgi:hypothetical protein
MVNPALVDWVRRQEMKGYDSQQIYLHLVNGGYDQKDVIEAINYSNSVNGNYPQPQRSVPMNNNVKKINTAKSSSLGLIVLLLFIVGIGGGAFYLYYTEQYIPLFEQVGLGHLVTPQIPDSQLDDSTSDIIDDTLNNENSDSNIIVGSSPAGDVASGQTAADQANTQNVVNMETSISTSESDVSEESILVDEDIVSEEII